MKTMTLDTLRASLLATFLFAGAVQAQTSDLPDPGILPDHPLYFMTSMSESIGTFFTFGDVEEAERALTLSEKRLAEAHAFAVQGKPDEAARAVERYREKLALALDEAEEARAEGDDADDVLADVSEKTPGHQAVLAEVYERVPEQARPGIERAMQASERGHSRAKRMTDRPRGRPDSPGRGPPRGPGPRQGPPG
ncbi:MAG: DUF5667 domain-containing protein, partial [Gemmatimonadota bacterium]